MDIFEAGLRTVYPTGVGNIHILDVSLDTLRDVVGSNTEDDGLRKTCDYLFENVLCDREGEPFDYEPDKMNDCSRLDIINIVKNTIRDLSEGALDPKGSAGTSD